MMRVTLNLEQSIWLQLLSRAHDEGLSPDEVVTAWLRRALRQERTILPRSDERTNVVGMPREGR